MAKRAASAASSGRRPGNVSFKILLLVGFLAMLYIGYKLFQETYKQNLINVEIANLQSDIEKLHQDNQDLNELISYLQTDQFKEKEAREKLNLIKQGEQLVLVKEKEIAVIEASTEEKKEAEVVIKRPNYYWWWHYYFSL